MWELGQKIGACPDHEIKIKRRIGMGWSAIGRQYNLTKSNFLLSLKSKVYNQCILPVLTWIRILKSYESPGMKISKCLKGNGENNVWHNMDIGRNHHGLGS